MLSMLVPASVFEVAKTSEIHLRLLGILNSILSQNGKMDKISLHKLHISAKILITLFLLTLLGGYLYALLNVFLSTRMSDGKKGLSVQDIKVKYYGNRSETRLEKTIDMTMHSYLPTEKAKKTIKDWIREGAGSEEYQKNVKSIFEKNCVRCHNPGGIRYQSPLTNYDEIIEYTKIDRGIPYESLAESSHAHVISMSIMFFLVGIIFFFSSFPTWLKIILYTVSFGSIVIDIGSWWLTKMLSPTFAYFVYFGGMLMALAFLLQILGSLYQLWLKR